MAVVQVRVRLCDGLMAVCQMPAQLLSLLHLKRTGEKKRWKSSWLEIKAGRSLTNYHHWQN